MSSVGRNDPCPCGSGRKFKKCCLGKDAPDRGAFTAEERRSALEQVFRFSTRPEFAEDQERADLAFWGDRLDDLTDDETKELVGLEQSQAAALEWFAFDFLLASGRTIVDLFLDRHGDRLRSGELRYLERMRRTHLRPYEVAAVKVDEGLELIDLWVNKKVRVRERAATHQLVEWDVIAAREAAVLDTARPKLVALLKSMENASARERREGRPAYDFGWMWEELGLERPG